MGFFFKGGKNGRGTALKIISLFIYGALADVQGAPLGPVNRFRSFPRNLSGEKLYWEVFDQRESCTIIHAIAFLYCPYKYVIKSTSLTFGFSTTLHRVGTVYGQQKVDDRSENKFQKREFVTHSFTFERYMYDLLIAYIRSSINQQNEPWEISALQHKATNQGNPSLIMFLLNRRYQESCW